MLHFFKPYLNKDIKKIMSSYQANLYKDQRLDMGCQRRDSIYFKIKKKQDICQYHWLWFYLDGATAAVSDAYSSADV